MFDIATPAAFPQREHLKLNRYFYVTYFSAIMDVKEKATNHGTATAVNV